GAGGRDGLPGLGERQTRVSGRTRASARGSATTGELAQFQPNRSDGGGRGAGILGREPEVGENPSDDEGEGAARPAQPRRRGGAGAAGMAAGSLRADTASPSRA